MVDNNETLKSIETYLDYCSTKLDQLEIPNNITRAKWKLENLMEINNHESTQRKKA